MQFRKIIMALLFSIPLCALAQETDITGLWKGTLFNDTTQKYYKYEIGISREKGRYTGFSHTWFLIGDTQYFGVKKITVKLAPDGKLIVEDNGLIAHNYPITPNKGVRQLNVLTLDASDSVMTLTGPFSTNRTKDYHSLTGSIRLQRKNDFWQSSLVPHLQELGKDEELSFVKEEKQLLVKADAAERDRQIAERLIAIKEEKAQVEKDKEAQAEAKREAAAKNKTEQTIAKKEAGRQIQEQKDLAKLEAIKAAEKQETAKMLTKEQVARQTAADKETARQLALKEKTDKTAALEKEKQDKLIAKQEAVKTAAAEKQQQEKATRELAKKQEPEKISSPVPSFKSNTEPAAEVASRKTVIQQTVSFSSDSLQLSLYDNGEIDGDTVSVLMNGQLILAKQGLGIRAIKHTIYIPHNVDKVEMLMYAETLGAIPPNTGLLVIRDGKDLYEIRFSGDLQKNASIILNRKKE